ncbi:MAG: hypothetical protein PHN88_10795 [Ignavibacteria bacterium]|nr:hypothetical protein [Ignavibacteria bacterium]
MTRKILMISSDREFRDYLNIVTLTITKLNHQITFTDDVNDIYTDFILIDLDDDFEGKLELIKKFRGEGMQPNKKIIAVKSEITDDVREKVFRAGCDSIMKKSEFRSAASNILII